MTTRPTTQARCWCSGSTAGDIHETLCQHGPAKVDIDWHGQKIAGGAQLWAIGTDVAKTQWIQIEVTQNGAPPAVESRDPARQHIEPERLPRRVHVLAPAESNITLFIDSVESSVATCREGPKTCSLD